MLLVFAAVTVAGLVALACEDGRLEPVLFCALAWFARPYWIAVSDGEFLAAVAALFTLCALLDCGHRLFHLVSGIFVLAMTRLFLALV